jgi:hypothetical protein
MRTRLFIVLSSLGLASASFGMSWLESGPDPVIFPRQEIPLLFDHAYHVRAPDEAKGLTGEGLDCSFCHENVSDSKDSADRDIPGHGTCETCHDDWMAEAELPACARCHADLSPAAKASPARTSTQARPVHIPPPNIVFPHANHVNAGVECVACHQNVPGKTLATRDDYPTMDRCVGCHEEKGVSTACTTCHFSSVAGTDRILTSFKEGKLMPRRLHQAAIHDADFLRDHAVPAMRDKAYCSNCHSEADCLECHDGVARDVRYHSGDFISTHSIKARIDDVRCQSCHRLQDFCLNCHVRSGVATVTAVNEFDPGRSSSPSRFAFAPHPTSANGWLTPGSQNFHGFHAQRNIRACASCHQEQYCIRCHGAGASSEGYNPHGPNAQRLRSLPAGGPNARVCLKCHLPGDSRWQ